MTYRKDGFVGSFNDKNNTFQSRTLQEFRRKLKDLTVRFHILQVDSTEFTCLKALTLFKPGTFSTKLVFEEREVENATTKCDICFLETSALQDHLHVEILQDQTQMMLFEYCSAKHSLRFGKLLLLLKSVGCFESRVTEEIFFDKFSKRGSSLAQHLISEALDR